MIGASAAMSVSNDIVQAICNRRALSHVNSRSCLQVPVRNENDGCFIDATRQHGRAMGKILISTAVVSLALIIAFAVFVITL